MHRLVINMLIIFGIASISQANIITATTAPKFTTAQYQSQTKVQIKNQINIMFNQLKTAFTSVFNAVWNNPNLTAQQVFTAFATDAAQLITIASTTQTMMNTIQPGTLTQTPPMGITVNSDNTVTVITPTPTPTNL